jgi:fructokinase
VVIVTRGADGLQILTSSSAASATPPVVDVVDTVGAGDTIVGIVLTSIAEHFDGGEIELSAVGSADWQVFAERAVAAAAITCSRAGADTPMRSELDW